MCRLLGFAAAGSDTSLNGVLGMPAVRDFRDLSEMHNDGWGSALVTVPSESPYLRDGGAPTPETGTAIYKNTIAARHDPIFDELANTPASWRPVALAFGQLEPAADSREPAAVLRQRIELHPQWRYTPTSRASNIITNRAFPSR